VDFPHSLFPPFPAPRNDHSVEVGWLLRVSEFRVQPEDFVVFVFDLF
jgi:hypothetical protein